MSGLRLGMKKRLRLTQFFLAILISIFIPLFSAFLDYYELADADFLSRNINFENPDQENLLIDQHDEFKVFISCASPNRFLPELELLEQFPLSPSATCSLDQKTFVLRC